MKLAEDEKQGKIPVFTFIVVAVNVLAYAVSEIYGSSLDSEHMIRMGAMCNWKRLVWPYLFRSGFVFRCSVSLVPYKRGTASCILWCVRSHIRVDGGASCVAPYI